MSESSGSRENFWTFMAGGLCGGLVMVALVGARLKHLQTPAADLDQRLETFENVASQAWENSIRAHQRIERLETKSKDIYQQWEEWKNASLPCECSKHP